jgi:hypothetical protein
VCAKTPLAEVFFFLPGNGARIELVTFCWRLVDVGASSSSSLSPTTVPEKSLMQYGVDIFSLSSWEPHEEGMMNIAARFSLS